MEKSKKIKLGIAAAVIVVIAAVAVRHFSGGKKGGMRPDMGGGQGANISMVRAEKPATGDIRLTTGLTGSVEPSDVVYVYAKASGDVTSVLVSAGDTVTQGQLLCEIDTEQVETAKNSMESAAVSLSEAQSTLNRMQILYNSGDISPQEYEQYSNKAKSASLQYESAKLAYERQVEYSQITAPISGKIESCDIEVHDRVNQNAQLCVIAGEGDKRVSFYVTERMMENISVGDVLDIQKDGSTYEAYISEISSMVDSATGLFKVKAELSKADGIATGSTVKLNLVTQHTENAMVVPVDAIYYSGGDGYVYIYDNGTIHMVQVEIGLYDSEYAEILGGLSADDLVVSTWSSNLYEGATVQLRGENASQTDGQHDGGQGQPAVQGQAGVQGQPGAESRDNGPGQGPKEDAVQPAQDTDKAPKAGAGETGKQAE
ncbi:efflux RND transporter periplasmic adaptor subunit [Lacrimispora sp. 210928-DFI.3.58]|uniref:efflux RND transporter periplasmic adaptor subunit n=1 Tax=Lacrimispora sp. 210928-DFI.3.58 TaxID=2883214 RepID=UPI001D06B914|nr:efflux RND transporter periplasmic adaptor subunit [Lacrimispora sp. 210928-DFI.3.58]MCB7317339.1 efflux RND transporter periplasmic adaptor subunit [Lacrimispora sp. 210928-DFI.3.58]